MSVRLRDLFDSDDLELMISALRLKRADLESKNRKARRNETVRADHKIPERERQIEHCNEIERVLWEEMT